MCCYFDDVIQLEFFDLDNILIYKKLHKSTLIYDISYKTLIDSKLDLKKNGFIRIYDRTSYLALFSSRKFDSIYNSFRCL